MLSGQNKPERNPIKPDEDYIAAQPQAVRQYLSILLGCPLILSWLSSPKYVIIMLLNK